MPTLVGLLGCSPIAFATQWEPMSHTSFCVVVVVELLERQVVDRVNGCRYFTFWRCVRQYRVT